MRHYRVDSPNTMKMKLLKKDYSSPHNYVFSLLYLMPREHFKQMLKKKCQCESSKKKSDLVIDTEMQAN